MHHSARRASHRVQQCPRVRLLAIEPFWKIAIQFDDQLRFTTSTTRTHSIERTYRTRALLLRIRVLLRPRAGPIDNSVPMQIISFIWRCDLLEGILVQCCPPAAAKRLYRAVLLQTAQASGMTFAQTSNVLDSNQQTTDSFHLPGRA